MSLDFIGLPAARQEKVALTYTKPKPGAFRQGLPEWTLWADSIWMGPTWQGPAGVAIVSRHDKIRYYTADLHFGHANIFDHSDRPFSLAEAAGMAIVEAWWRVLTEKDVVFGDLGGPPTGTEHVRSLLAKSPASVRWVKGNHDRDSWPDALEPLATYHGDRVEIKTDRSDPRDDHPVFLVLDHYTMASWNQFYHGAVQLHGHVRGGLDSHGIRRFDVGIESVGAEPVPMRSQIA